ncbi:hypothetical protein VNO77_02192 [Canavalia gladiata]|uniref:Uncharacterized protein n=1 Tax=Canavalia gladiata TaxID=3824 RepID=A0AAN9MSK9_CANGL
MPQKSQATINYDSDRISFADYRGRMQKRNATRVDAASKFIFRSAVSSENALKSFDSLRRGKRENTRIRFREYSASVLLLSFPL